MDQAETEYKRGKERERNRKEPQGPATIPVTFRRVGIFPNQAGAAGRGQEGLEEANHKGIPRLQSGVSGEEGAPGSASEIGQAPPSSK